MVESCLRSCDGVRDPGPWRGYATNSRRLLGADVALAGDWAPGA